MKISMMSYTMARGKWGKNPSVEELCKFTQKLGLEGIDWVTTYEIEPKEIRHIMDDFGLKTVCYTFFADINFPDKKSRQPGLDKIKEGLVAASVLRTDKVMLPIGGKKEYSREESRKNVIEGLKDIVKIGKEFNIIITVEHFPDIKGPFLTSSDVNQAIKEVPELRITYDSGNVIIGKEDPVKGFLNSKDYIVHSHFKDWVISENGRPGMDGKLYEPALVGEGVVNYKSVINAMRQAGYNGYINLEYEGKKYTPENAMIKGVKFLKSIMKEN